MKAHLTNNKTCLNIRSIPLDNKFVCNSCDSIFTLKTNLTKHINVCKKLKVETNEKTIFELKQTSEKTNNELKEYYEKIIFELKQNHYKTIKELQFQNEKLLNAFEKLATHAVDRPTTSTTSTTSTVNNIRNNFSDKYFIDTLKNEDIKNICINHLTEQVFFEGQKGIAQLCTDHIIKTKDNKILLVCTDISRKKFKYLDEQLNLNEDHEARIFTEKVSKPIKDASKALYENILSDVNYERENLEEDEIGKKEQLHHKTMKAIDCFMNITNFDDSKYNTEFKNELAILNK
jgi:uncharacterized C2H2 Zn-finger protein